MQGSYIKRVSHDRVACDIPFPIEFPWCSKFFRGRQVVSHLTREQLLDKSDSKLKSDLSLLAHMYNVMKMTMHM